MDITYYILYTHNDAPLQRIGEPRDIVAGHRIFQHGRVPLQVEQRLDEIVFGGAVVRLHLFIPTADFTDEFRFIHYYFHILFRFIHDFTSCLDSIHLRLLGVHGHDAPLPVPEPAKGVAGGLVCWC